MYAKATVWKYNSSLLKLFDSARKSYSVSCSAFKAVNMKNNIASIQYPSIRKDDSVHEEIFGKTVKDPFRWLEDPDSSETKEFVKAQNQVFEKHIDQYSHRKELKDRFTTLYNYEKFGCPFKRGSYYYFFHNSGLQAQSVLYQQDSLELTEEKRVFYDPNSLTTDGTAALSSFSFSESGKYFAYGVSRNGSDWVTIQVQDNQRNALEDTIEWVKFSSITWTHDEKGFFYLRYDKPATDNAGTETSANLFGKLYYHRLGEKQDQDVIIFEDKVNGTWQFGAEVTDDGDYLLLYTTESCDPVNRLYISKLEDKKVPHDAKFKWTKVVDNFDAKYNYITNNGTKFYFLSNLNAPRYRVVSYDLQNQNAGFQDHIPQSDNIIEEVVCFAEDKLAVNYSKDVKNVLSVHSLESGSKVYDIPLEIGSVDSIDGKRNDFSLHFRFVSFLNPGIIYQTKFSKANGFSTQVIRETKLSGFNRDDFVIKQVFYTSKDGKTKVPMFITHPKNLHLDGSNPCYLYGYGGFSISLTPFFSPLWVSAMQSYGAIFAVANIRGGAEYGEEWHKAGCLLNKQNGFDDFCSAAEFLVHEKYTSSEKLAINGGSNGGLLAMACALQRPDLFGASVADVGVLDMLRFHKFTIGHAWISDYGDPDKPEFFNYLLRYSPLHNVKKIVDGSSKHLPSILLTTSDHDDRVVPLHSFKMIATLQSECPNNANPLLIRIETNAGHGAGKSTAKRIEEAVDKFSFIALACNWPWNK